MIEEQTFNNRYRLDQKLGEGGMATVYCGTDTVLRRRVAIKVLRPQYAADAEFVRRFYQEAESAAKLNHPNIVNTYDVGREGDTYYIVMELVDGPTLAEIIAADGKLPEPVAIDYAAQICSGLAFAHRAGLLHRDIKPANILVTKDDVVKLSDFGIARAVSQHTMAMTKPGLVMGSIYYLSPEQAQGQELHETSDLYSVGVVLYQMLTGRLPYTGESPVTVALKHIGDPVPTIDVDSMGVSPALASIVNKLLQKTPENRFHSASDVATALREARERPTFAAYPTMDDAPSGSRTSPSSPPPPRPSRYPDRRYDYPAVSDAEPRPARGGGRLVLLLVAVALLAAAIGYAIVARPFRGAFSQQIVLGDYRSMKDSQAQQAIANAGLAWRIYKTPSDTVPANEVIRQAPQAGTKVAAGQLVELYVSNGLPTVGLDDMRGYTVRDATMDLKRHKFLVRVVRRYDPAPTGSVIDQRPAPGTQVRQGSLVTLYASEGLKPVKIPNLVGMKYSDAIKLAQGLGFKIAPVNQPFDTIPPDVIASQDVPAGTTVQPYTATVNVVVSTGGSLTVVPSVISQDAAAGQAALQQAGFNVSIQWTVQPGSQSNGSIVDQNPEPNTTLPKGSTVTVAVSVPGEVPDTNGMTIVQATATLQAAGYTVGKTLYTSQGADGNVVRTDPAVGTTLAPGSTVDLLVNNGPPGP